MASRGPNFEALRGPHRHLLSGEQVKLTHSNEGVWHIAATWQCKLSKSAAPKVQTFFLDLLGDEELCATCFEAGGYNNPLTKNSVYQQLLNFYGIKDRLKTISKIYKSTSAVTVQKRIVEAREIIERLGEDKYFLPELDQERSELRELFKETLDKLEKATSSDAVKAKIEKAVKSQMVPAKFREQEFELDATMVMIGISPTPALGQWMGAKQDTFLAIVDAYALHKGESTVLYAPAYFYSYLLGRLFFKKAASNYLIVSAQAPSSAEARDNAAHLWDPQNDSTLACLSSAIRSGEALSG